MNDGFLMMIPKNEALPARHTEIFTTVADSRTELEIVVLQADYKGAAGSIVGTASAATRTGSFKVVGLPAKGCAELQVAVTFSVTCQGRLHVEAVERTTGLASHIAIERSLYG